MKRPIIRIEEDRCDGCGACVIACAEGALQIVDGKAKLISETFCDGLGACLHCPRGALRIEEREAAPFDATKHTNPKKALLPNWPIQLRLIPPQAPFLTNAHLLLASHCTAFGLPTFQKDFLTNTALAIACPKLEPKDLLLKRLTEIFSTNPPTSITLLRMSVPCCGALTNLLTKAMDEAKINIPTEIRIVERP